MAKRAAKAAHEQPRVTIEERVERGIREGWIRPAKAPFDWEEWEKMPKPDMDPEVAARIVRDLIENR